MLPGIIYSGFEVSCGFVWLCNDRFVSASWSSLGVTWLAVPLCCVCNLVLVWLAGVLYIKHSFFLL